MGGLKKVVTSYCKKVTFLARLLAEFGNKKCQKVRTRYFTPERAQIIFGEKQSPA